MATATLETKALNNGFEPNYKTGSQGYKTVHLSDEPRKYSPIDRGSYDKERHIPAEDALGLLNDSGLDISKLRDAVSAGEISVYDFKGQPYLDRLDIGRVYHTVPEQRTGLTVEPYFSKPGKDPLNSVKFTDRHLEIKDFKTGKVIFSMDAEMPEWMTETDASIVAQKYFFKPSKSEWKERLTEIIGSDHEYSLKHLGKRVADFFTDEGWKLGYFAAESDREAFRNELLFLQVKGMGAFNSPTQFNAGLFNSYGIAGSEGINYHRDPATGEVTKVLNGEYIHPQLHACFIKGPNDDLESISQHVLDEVAIFASGSGVGHDIGKLRGEGEDLSGGGKASGPNSFLKIYDRVAGAIKSGGKTRRAARMTTMRYQHPDIMEFIEMKVQEDRKALVLMQNGFSTGMDGEAYTTVALQNTNLSVRLDDNFFDALRNGRDVQTYNVNNGKPAEMISADRMLKEIAFGSWRIGDPAVQYESKIQEMHTAKNSGRQNSTNPCSEYLFLDDTSCSLFSMRLTAFMNKNGTFNYNNFDRALRVFTIAQNIANEAASYPVKEIAAISPEFGTIGGGYADLGSYLMRSGIPYDSEKGRAVGAAITAMMTGSVYKTSAEIAKGLGSFTHFEFNKKPMMEVMGKHQASLENIAWGLVKDKGLKNAAYEAWQSAVDNGEKFGYRNAQATVLAPTGTISFLMGCSTTGVEPGLSLSMNKNLAGGGNITILNKDTNIALAKLGYSEQQMSDIAKYLGKHNTMINAPHVDPSHYSVFDTAFGNSKGEGSISFEGHVRMLGATQPFISGAISKTNNLPESATVRDIYEGYLLGHELGLKAISIFRNKSKPIAAVDFGGNSFVKLKRGEKKDLPPSRAAWEWEYEVNGVPFHMTVSEYEDGTPGQIAFLSFKEGSTVKSMLAIAGIAASKALKRGVHLEDAIDGWSGHQFEPSGLLRGHPFIKTANSPLDGAYKIMRFEYLGDIEMAEHDLQKDVKMSELRGFKNGAFRTYQRMKVDEWKFEDVMNDFETGGFVAPSGLLLLANGNGNGTNGKNKMGRTCNNCGRIMLQTGPNCFKCDCGDSVGGCGA